MPKKEFDLAKWKRKEAKWKERNEAELRQMEEEFEDMLADHHANMRKQAVLHRLTLQNMDDQFQIVKKILLEERREREEQKSSDEKANAQQCLQVNPAPANDCSPHMDSAPADDSADYIEVLFVKEAPHVITID